MLILIPNRRRLVGSPCCIGPLIPFEPRFDEKPAASSRKGQVAVKAEMTSPLRNHIKRVSRSGSSDSMTASLTLCSSFCSAESALEYDDTSPATESNKSEESSLSMREESQNDQGTTNVSYRNKLSTSSLLGTASSESPVDDNLVPRKRCQSADNVKVPLHQQPSSPEKNSLHYSLHESSYTPTQNRRRARRSSIASATNVESEIQASSSHDELKAWEMETGWGSGSEGFSGRTKKTEDKQNSINFCNDRKHNSKRSEQQRLPKKESDDFLMSAISKYTQITDDASTKMSSSSSHRRRRRASIATSMPAQDDTSLSALRTGWTDNEAEDTGKIKEYTPAMQIKEYPPATQKQQQQQATTKVRRYRRGRRSSLGGCVQKEHPDMADDSIADMSDWDDVFLSSYNSFVTKHSTSSKSLKSETTNRSIPSTIPIKKGAMKSPPVPSEPEELPKTGWTDDEFDIDILKRSDLKSTSKSKSNGRRRRGRRNSIGTSVPSEKADLVEDSISDLSAWTDTDCSFRGFSTPYISNKPSLTHPLSPSKGNEKCCGNSSILDIQTGWTDDEGETLRSMHGYTANPSQRGEDPLKSVSMHGYPSPSLSHVSASTKLSIGGSRSRRGGRRNKGGAIAVPQGNLLPKEADQSMSDIKTGWTDDENDFLLPPRKDKKISDSLDAESLRRPSLAKRLPGDNCCTEAQTGWTDDEDDLLFRAPQPRRTGRRASMGSTSIDTADQKTLDYLNVTGHRQGWSWNTKDAKAAEDPPRRRRGRRKSNDSEKVTDRRDNSAKSRQPSNYEEGATAATPSKQRCGRTGRRWSLAGDTRYTRKDESETIEMKTGWKDNEKGEDTPRAVCPGLLICT